MSRTLPIEELLGEAVWLRRLAASLVSDAALADDLVQDTWVSALRSPPAGDARPWLARVVRNLASNAHRARGRREARESTVRREDVVPGSDDLAQRAEVQRLVAEAVTRLPEPLRDAVVLRYFQGLDSTVAAQRLGIPPSTLRTRLQRAIETLREDLDRRVQGGRAAWAALVAPLAAGSRIIPATTALATVSLPSGLAAGLVAAGLATVALTVVLRERTAPDLVSGVVASGTEKVSTEPPREPATPPSSGSVAAAGVPGGRETLVAQADQAAQASPAADPPSATVVAGTILVDGRAPEWPIDLALEPLPARAPTGGLMRRVPGPRMLHMDPADGGTFRFEGLPPDWRGRLKVSPDRFADGGRILELEAPSSELNLALFSVPSFTGRVSSRSGSPGAWVSGTAMVRGGDDSRGVTAFTDTTPFQAREDGRFRIPMPRAKQGGWNSVEVVIRTPGAFAHLVAGPFPGGGEVDLGDLILEPVRGIPFLVTDPHGRPVEGAMVSIDGLAWAVASDETGLDGLGELNDVPDRPLQIRAGALAYRDAVVTANPGDLLEVVLEPLTMLVVSWDAFPGDELRVTSTRPAFVEDPVEREWLPGSSVPSSARAGSTSIELRFPVDLDDPDLRLVDLVPGVVLTLEILDASGTVLDSRTASLAQGEHSRMRFEVDREVSGGLLRKQADPQPRISR